MGKDVHEIATEYEQMVKAIFERQAEWVNCKKKIFDYLTLQLKIAGFGQFRVGSNAEHTNLEAVGLQELIQPSGIIYKGRALTRRGAKLIYRQDQNGFVEVVARMPYVEEIEQVADDVNLGSIEPSKISQGLMDDHLSRFFSLLCQSQKSQSRIGFQVEF